MASNMKTLLLIALPTLVLMACGGGSNANGGDDSRVMG